MPTGFAAAESTGSIERIAVLRALKLGDLLCAVPAWRALREGFPRAHITLISLPWAEEFARRFSHLIDEFVEFPGYPGLPERSFDPRTVARFLGEMQTRRFDLALQMHGSGSRVNEIVCLLGARRTGGFYEERDSWRPEGAFWRPYPGEEPEIWRLLRLVQLLEVPLRGLELEFPLSADEIEGLDVLLGSREIRNGGYVCLHPGGDTVRAWKPEQFGRLGAFLRSSGFHVVFTGAPRDRELCERAREAMGADAIVAAGRTDLGLLGALIRESRLLVSHDTGVAHIAAALGTPSIVVFEGPESRGWPSLDRCRHRFLTHPEGVGFPMVCDEIEDLLAYAHGNARGLSRADGNPALRQAGASAAAPIEEEKGARRA